MWLQAVLENLESGDYANLRQGLLPLAPIPIPACLTRELEFAERRCRNVNTDRLFPIRFMWLLEANEQRQFNLLALGRSRYHPEKLLDLWNRACTDSQYRQEREAEGYKFNFSESAVQLTEGWVYIGHRFVQDFLEVEAILGTDLLFEDSSDPSGRPVFENFKRNMTMDANAIQTMLLSLASKKPVFCSEMDFQLHLAWEMKERGFDLSLEFDPQCLDGNAAIDMLVHSPHRVAIELKYKTAEFSCKVHGQPLKLKHHGAQDSGRYDFLKDLSRLERVVSERQAQRGFAIFLTNDSGYWREGRHPAADEMFRIFEGRAVSGGTHEWAPGLSKGTIRGREEAISLTRDYVFGWKDFSNVTGANGEFRYLLVEVEPVSK